MVSRLGCLGFKTNLEATYAKTTETIPKRLHMNRSPNQSMFSASFTAAIASRCRCFFLKPKTHIGSTARSLRSTFPRPLAQAPPRQLHMGGGGNDGSITLQEWRGWGPSSPFPAMVSQIVEDLRLLERDIEAQMSFGGNGGKLQGSFRIEEDKKHRSTYQALGDSEKKLQFFAARQIACRLLGSRGYLCQKCWLPMEDCMCSKVKPRSLWHGIQFWLYMHPKDFLRQNNTGKLLWQIFGVEAARLCLFGIAEDEEMMWNSFKQAGKSNVWCLYPNKTTASQSIQESFGQESSPNLESNEQMKANKTRHFILIDGTWSNSGAMFKRLKDKAKLVWGDEDFSCVSLPAGASAMHKLRPQPSWDRTCTAAAAAELLSELHNLPQFSTYDLNKQAEVVEDALTVLLEALTTRRLRMGRSITRKVRHSGNIC